jgi:hypothetical protein
VRPIQPVLSFPRSLETSIAGPGSVKAGIEVYLAISALACATRLAPETVVDVLLFGPVVVADDEVEVELPQAAARIDSVTKLLDTAIGRLHCNFIFPPRFLWFSSFPHSDAKASN